MRKIGELILRFLDYLSKDDPDVYDAEWMDEELFQKLNGGRSNG